MKMIITIIILSINLSWASNGYAQKDKFSISMKQKSVREVFYTLEKSSGYRFFYNDNFNYLDNLVSINAEKQSLNQILDGIFQQTDFEYKILDNKLIVVTIKKELLQNKVRISGKVTDQNGQPMFGVSVSIKGTQKVALTDENGSFSFAVVDNNATLVFSFIGFITQEHKLTGENIVNIKMAPSIKSLDEVVVVAFGTQKKNSLVSSIETINPSELKVASSNLTTAMAGRLAGLISYQRSGEPGADNAEFFIRGVTTFGYKKDPLILIDGIETNSTELARMQPDDISSFSIMKDATASALYGSRGANGVILITTKSGVEGPVKISVRYESSISSNTRDIQMADPITYMKLSNEAVLTRNPINPLPYSQNKIDNTNVGLNPYIYPANDWIKQLIKKNTINQRLNFSASGGGKVAKYYIAGTYNKDNGILNVDKRSNFNSNIDLKSYQLRSNININLTKTTEVIVRLSGSFDDYTGPIDGGSGTYSKIMRSNPVAFPAYYPASVMPNVNHILFGNVRDQNYINPYADLVKGYKNYSKSLMDAQFELKQDFSFITPGLTARGMFNTTRYSYFDVSRFYNPYFYEALGYDKAKDSYSLNLLNSGNATEYLNYSESIPSINTSNYLEGALNYNKTIATKNELGALLVYYQRQQIFSNQGSLEQSLPYVNRGLSGRFTYAYDSRYMVELNFGYNGSERFYKTHRYGFFPAVGFGWNVYQEKFWKPIQPIISKLKLKATYGLVGNDAIGSASDRFFYLFKLNMNDGSKGYSFGENYLYSKNGITFNRYDNRDITWEIAKKLNLGVELGLFKDINIQVDYYTEKRSNILMDRYSIPTTMGLSATPRANVGKAKGNGVDISIDYNKNLTKDLWIQTRANFTYAHSEYVAYEEPMYNETYKTHIGQAISQQFGLIAERLFVDENEVANSPKQNYGQYGAGDIKYRDVNGDGQITDLDQVPIGNPTMPEIMYGFGFSLGYKGFDLSAFFQGSGKSSFWIDANATAPFVNNNQLLKVYADSHWSEENRNLYAIWPRLSINNVNNNTQLSTWFMRDGSFLRFKTLELGYKLPKNLISKFKIQNVRIYGSGNNLLLISGFNLWDIEMGGNGLGYPVQKVFNFGVQIGF